MPKPVEPQLVPVTCSACRECYRDPRYNRCIAGGPYRGFNTSDGTLLNRAGETIGKLTNDQREWYPGEEG